MEINLKEKTVIELLTMLRQQSTLSPLVQEYIADELLMRERQREIMEVLNLGFEKGEPLNKLDQAMQDVIDNADKPEEPPVG